ncbi:MAG: archease [Actinobacteria bacterium]|nr:archease [Actinomycetota bacterium]
MDCSKKHKGFTLRFLEHTADVGIEVIAPDKKSALEAAGCALLNLIIDTSSVENKEKFEINLGPFTDDGDMLFEFLNEIIYLADAKSVVFRSVSVVEVSEIIKAYLEGEQFNPSKHIIKEQVKAATYHQLVFEKIDKGWFARVIFDV